MSPVVLSAARPRSSGATPSPRHEVVSAAPRATPLEPEILFDAFERFPPEGFRTRRLFGRTLAFEMRFDLRTTMQGRMRRLADALPFRLRLRTLFVGSTVAEYTLLDPAIAPEHHIAQLREIATGYPLTIVRDLPSGSPLLAEADNAHADELARVAAASGFVLLAGQALAYVPIDFASIDEFLARLSRARRRHIRRKLRARDELVVETRETGASFDDPRLVDRLYALYLSVYAQSDIHFDRLSRAFFAGALGARGGGGLVFLYRVDERIVGFNLCYVREGRLVDKYIGLDYAHAHRLGLYVVSWFENLEYARSHGLHTYVAGWTDPEIKASLGASLTYTRHAVFVRNRLLRAVLRTGTRWFETCGARDATARRP